MNRESEIVKNFLFIVKDMNDARKFHELSLEFTEKNHSVLFISRRPCHLLALLSNQELLREKLKKYIMMYFENIEDIIRRLLELHDWSMTPNLIVLDLNTFLKELFDESDKKLINTESVMKSVCFCVATLFDYMNSLERKLLNSLSKRDNDRLGAANPLAHSVVLLGEHTGVLSQKQIELIINLYFYKNSAFDDFNELKEKIVTTWNS